jgi:hypothetical protein
MAVVFFAPPSRGEESACHPRSVRLAPRRTGAVPCAILKAMSPGGPSLVLTPFGREQKVLLVHAASAVMLCRDGSHGSCLAGSFLPPGLC